MVSMSLMKSVESDFSGSAPTWSASSNGRLSLSPIAAAVSRVLTLSPTSGRHLSKRLNGKGDIAGITE